MNFADFGLGTWHPKGGMYQIIRAMKSLAQELGVIIHTDSTVEKIIVKGGKATGILVNSEIIEADTTPDLSEEDIKTVMEQANVDENSAKEALILTKGDIAEAIIGLKE